MDNFHLAASFRSESKSGYVKVVGYILKRGEWDVHVLPLEYYATANKYVVCDDELGALFFTDKEEAKTEMRSRLYQLLADGWSIYGGEPGHEGPMPTQKASPSNKIGDIDSV